MRRVRTRRFTRGRRPRQWEMQQLSICRTPLSLTDADFADCSQPAQFMTGLVSPRREFASSGTVGSEPLPAFSKGVTVGGLRFRYSYSLNSVLAFGVGLDNTDDTILIRSALVVLPLADSSTELPGVFPTNMLHHSQSIPEVNTTPGLGYYKPRILWRGYDELHFIGRTLLQDPPNAGYYSGYDKHQDSSYKRRGAPLEVVKSKVSLGHNDCLYFLSEIVLGFTIPEGEHFSIELDFFGVAPVKPTTATRP